LTRLRPDESFLIGRLRERAEAGSLRVLSVRDGLVDFSSNDYLGVARSLRDPGQSGPDGAGQLARGSTGSRLISGNSEWHERAEAELAEFYGAEAALVFNSGYDANLGLLSGVPSRGDTIVYDELSHASIRDGVRLGLARSFSFRHNDLADLELKLEEAARRGGTGEQFVVVESVYSVDGDLAPLTEIAEICATHGAHLYVDEAHATGVFGPSGKGLVAAGGLEASVFARVHTFGKALGSHGAAIVGSELLRHSLVNFARSFIYTTALPPDSIERIRHVHRACERLDDDRDRLFRLVEYFRERSRQLGIPECLPRPGPVQILGVAGNHRARGVSDALREAGLDVRAILAPTVPAGQERLRVCLHSFNTVEEIDRLLECFRLAIGPGRAGGTTA
jgi:8-amino-7-oxononanoate synthase